MPKEEIAKIYNKLTERSASTPYLLNGITAQPIKLIIKVIIGDKIKINLLELLGKTVSLTNSLNPSANGCNKPYAPTTLGPRRR